MTITERVAKGAALLDKHVPHWAESVNADRLRMASACQCVLGQVFGWYFGGLKEMNLISYNDECKYGFNAYDVVDSYAEYDLLEAAWMKEIEARL